MADAAKGFPRRDAPTQTHPALRNDASAHTTHCEPTVAQGSAEAPGVPGAPTASATLTTADQPLALQTAANATFVAGRYQLLQRIAIGGMAEIWRARMVGLAGFSRTVVLKRMLPHLALDPVFVTLFLDEARLGARLHHHNIVAVLDIGSDPDDGYFFAMESLDGADLRALLARGPLPLDLVIWVALNVCAGLHYAHTLLDEHHQPLGIVHRDISPANIFVCNDGGVKLVDFGIARSTTRTEATDPGAVRGKLRYMSPEQARAATLDARSDIFSLGAVLFELIANCPLFGQRHDAGVLDALLNQPIPSVCSAAPQCPAELAAIVDKALARAPDARYASADAMAGALAAWARKAGVWPAATAASTAVALARHDNFTAPLATRTFDVDAGAAQADAQRAATNDFAIAPDTLARLRQLTATTAVPAPPETHDIRAATQRDTVSGVDGAATEATSSAIPGSAIPGSAIPGPAIPGSAVSGSAGPGSAVPDSAGPGSAIPGPAIPGSAVPGSAVPDSAGPGSAIPGSAIPGPGSAAHGAPDRATTARHPPRAGWRMIAWGVGVAVAAVAAITAVRLATAPDPHDSPLAPPSAPSLPAASGANSGAPHRPHAFDAAPSQDRVTAPPIDAASKARSNANAARDDISPNPAATQPVPPGPSAAQPSAALPSASQPSAVQPSTAQPSAAQPSAAQPSAAQPSASQPSASSKTRPRSGNHSDRNPPAIRPTPTQLAAPLANPGAKPPTKPDPDAFRPGAP